ncbi:MAG: hypothetical protein QOC82_856 [Frankiaceae bacterium]|jgi:hypothetical protein|nr:hypothetical protein [Frankiaceae bacterium]
MAAAMVSTLVGIPLAPPAGAAEGTWSGTWHRAENGVDGELILTQKGNTVTGHYTWNSPGGTVGGTVHGSTFDGTFNEAHYRGSFTLALHGTTFSGTYSGENKDTHGDIAGPFDGTCTGGECLNNGSASTPSASANPSASASADADAEAELLKALAEGRPLDEIIETIVNNSANEFEAREFAHSLMAQLDATVPSGGTETDQKARLLLVQASLMGACRREDGTPLLPAVNGLLPVLGSMVLQGLAVGKTDPAAAKDFIVAGERLLRLTLRFDFTAAANAAANS